MIEPGLDGRALATVPRPHPAFSPAGLLRKEHFGALMYLRTDASTTAIPPALARLLVDARQASVLDLYARDVKLRVTVARHNVDHLRDFAALATELGVQRVVFKPFALLGQAAQAHALVVNREDYLRAVDTLLRQWPEHAVPMDCSDGIPTRAPAWTRISPSFGCIAGSTSLTVSYDDGLLGCGCVRDDDDWSVHRHGLIDGWRRAPGVARWRSLQAGSRCRGCEQRAVCAGACRARALAKGEMGDADPGVDCPGLSSVDVTGKSALTAR